MNRTLLVALFLLALVAGTALQTARTAKAAPITLVITITRVVEVDCDDNELDLLLVEIDSCGNDYYAKFFLNDVESLVTPRAPDDETDITPGWQFQFTVDSLALPRIAIEIWDHDITTDDDRIDIADGGDALVFRVVPATLQMLKDGTATPQPGFSTGSGEDSAKIFFTLSIGGGDLDNDGIPDGYEAGAPILNLDGTDSGVNLQALGASPCRANIAVEFDYMQAAGHTHQPLAGALTEVQNMFSNASWPPAPAGCPYSGITAQAGIGFIARVDQALPEVDKINFTSGPTNVQAIRDANFNAALRPWFHYSVFIHNQPDLPDSTGPGGDPDTLPDVNSSSGLCCGNQGKDFIVSLGQWTNSVGTVRQQSGTIVHELGHALGLEHGGADVNNCKPNYISAMSYVFQFGVPDSTQTPVNDIDGDGKIDSRDRSRLDYSREDLPDLVEGSLNENQGVGRAVVTVWDTDGSGPFKVSTGTLAIDWNGVNGLEANVTADVNNMGISGSQGCGSPTPGDTLTGFDDWRNLKFRAAMSASAGIAIHSDDHERMTLQRYNYIRAGIHDGLSTTDLALSITDSPDPAGAGGQYAYSLTVANNGPHIAEDLELKQTLPSDATFVSASAGCSHSSGVVTCTKGDLDASATWTVSVTVSVPANLVFNNGGPKTLTSTASVKHDGPDPATANNNDSESTLIIALADLKVDSHQALSVPSQILVGGTESVTIRTTVSNGGPSSPINATVSRTTSALAGATVSAPTTPVSVPSLTVGTPQTFQETYTLGCTAPGYRTYTFATSIAATDPLDQDPDLTNNAASVTLTIDCVVPVAINIKPRSNPNSIQLSSTGDIPVAVLTTLAGEYGLPLAFNAQSIDAVTVRFGPRGPVAAGPGAAGEIHGTGHLEDSVELGARERIKDGDLDMLLHFSTPAAGLNLSDTEACVKGSFAASDGNTYRFFGCDAVRVVP